MHAFDNHSSHGDVCPRFDDDGDAQAPTQPASRLELISVNNNGAQGDNDSDVAALSADGRFFAFASIADNLVPNDNNVSSDVFIRDRVNRTTERVSVGPNGVEGDANSGFLDGLGGVSISADGRFVAFASEASNFAPGDQPFTADVFVRDRQTGSIERIDVASDGSIANGFAFDIAISADGRFVAFDTDAGNLVPGDGDDAFDVFVRDRLAGTTEGITTRVPTDTFTGNSFVSSISADGRWVAFQSNDPTLAHHDRNGFFQDAFVFDRKTSVLHVASVSTSGVQSDNDSFNPLVSADGRFVVFTSRADNLVRNDTNQSADVFRRDLAAGTTTRLAADTTSADHPFGFDVTATAVTPDTTGIALLTRAELLPEQATQFSTTDVYALSAPIPR